MLRRTTVRSRRRGRDRVRPLCLLLALGLASPASSYILFLEDGRQMQIKEKYERDGDRVIVVLPSGSQAFLDASEVDFEKTEQVNQENLGSAVLLEGVGEEEERQKPPPPDEESLGDIIASRQQGLSLPPPRRRDRPSQVKVPRTGAGFLDLMTMARRPYTDGEVTSELLRYLKGQGVEEVKMFQGSREDRPLLEVVANSEASVFKVLKDAANALVQLEDRFPERITGFELLMVTDAQIRAGQFVMTPELANELVSGSVDGPTFFLRYVQF